MLNPTSELQSSCTHMVQFQAPGTSLKTNIGWNIHKHAYMTLLTEKTPKMPFKIGMKVSS